MASRYVVGKRGGIGLRKESRSPVGVRVDHAIGGRFPRDAVHARSIALNEGVLGG